MAKRRITKGRIRTLFSLTDVLDAFDQKGWVYSRSGQGEVKCSCVHPDHEDEDPSMSLSESDDGRVLVHCFAGCDQGELFDSLLDFMGKGRKAPSQGCTLSQYADLKQLPPQFLEELGLRDDNYRGLRRLVIPYGDDAVRYRIALSGSNKFKWRSGSQVQLYGLDERERFEGSDEVLIVEGESCAQTAWFHGLPAFGVPGANNWKEERDAIEFDKFSKIHVLIEPDRGGDAVLRWLAKSSIRDRAYLLILDGYEDLSDLHLSEPEDFDEILRDAMDIAESWHDYQARQKAAVASEAWEKGKEIAEAENILSLFREEAERHGVVGELENASIVYLVATSRLFRRPVSLLVKGPSSAGKSYVVERALQFFPNSAYKALSAMSERALIYWEEDMVHRMLVLYEEAAVDSETMSYLVRSLLSEGQIKYVTVESTGDGIGSREIERPGPTGLILTTTKISIHAENETRMLSILVSDSPEQTARVVNAIAIESESDDLGRWQAFQEWLELGGPTEVAVPFAVKLGQAIQPLATRVRRDFTALLTLVRAHALLHRASRHVEDGKVIATLDDYDAVRGLVGAAFAEAWGASVSPEVEEVVAAVRLLCEEAAGESGSPEGKVRIVANTEPPGVSNIAVARYLDLDNSTAWRRIQGAIRLGYIVNRTTRKGVKADLVPGETPVNSETVLPSRKDLS